MLKPGDVFRHEDENETLVVVSMGDELRYMWLEGGETGWFFRVAAAAAFDPDNTTVFEDYNYLGNLKDLNLTINPTPREYQPGDRVVLRDDLVRGENYSHTEGGRDGYVTGMAFPGSTVTLRSNDSVGWRIVGEGYHYPDSMFLKLAEGD